MTTYRQENSWIEDGYGEVRIVVTVSDSYDGMFAAKADCVNADIFYLNEVSKGISRNVGGKIESELAMEIDEFEANTDDEKTAIDFVKAASTNPAIRRFCAVFVNPSDPPQSDEMLLNGLVQPEFEGDDIIWESQTEYDELKFAIRRWKLKVKPYQAMVIQSVELTDLIYGNTEKHVTGIPADWEAANVADRQGFYKWIDRNTMHYKLVDLSKLIRRLADNMTATIAAQGYGTMNFVFNRSPTDGHWHPARWVHAKIKVWDSDGYKYPRYTYCNKYKEFGIATSDRGGADFMVYSGDYNELVLDPDGTHTDAETPWICYNSVKSGITADDPREDGNKELRIDKKCKDFVEFLENIAINFGCFLDWQQTSADTVTISFRRRQDFIVNKFYLKGAEKGSVKISPNIIKDNANSYSGQSSSIAPEGKEYIQKHILETVLYYDLSKQSNDKKGASILFTLSPTTVINQVTYKGMRCRDYEGPEDDLQVYDYVRFPYNSFFADGGNEKTNAEYGRSPGFHSAIYLNVGPTALHSAYTDADHEPSRWWTPAAMLSLNIGGSDYTYNNLSDYLNYVYDLDNTTLSSEYELEIPYMFGFSENADGTSPKWDVLKIGSTCRLDNIDYFVNEIKFSLSEPHVSLKLHGTKNMSFASPVNPVPGPTLVLSPEVSDDRKSGNKEDNRLANGAITKLCAVSLRTDGSVEKSLPVEAHYGRIYGLALADADDGKPVQILTQGKAKIPDEWPDLTPSAVIYLRKPAPDGSNLSDSFIVTPDATEHLYCAVARVENARELNISDLMQENYIFQY